MQLPYRSRLVAMYFYVDNHILIDFIYSFPYRKVCNYFQIAHFLGQ